MQYHHIMMKTFVKGKDSLFEEEIDLYLKQKVNINCQHFPWVKI